jgi:hypothetical protein
MLVGAAILDAASGQGPASVIPRPAFAAALGAGGPCEKTHHAEVVLRDASATPRPAGFTSSRHGRTRRRFAGPDRGHRRHGFVVVGRHSRPLRAGAHQLAPGSGNKGLQVAHVRIDAGGLAAEFREFRAKPLSLFRGRADNRLI